MTLNELAASPPRTEPWLLVVMTSTYTSNPPSNATAFKSWLERTEQDEARWRTCRYFVWGLGNSQWNAFLAFPRYVHKKLSELGATPLAELAYGDVGSPVWERLYADWNTPRLACPPRAVRGPADVGRRRARRCGEGGHGHSDEHRLEHGNAEIALRQRCRDAANRPVDEHPLDHALHIARITESGHVDGHVGIDRTKPQPVAGVARSDDPHERCRKGHDRGTYLRMPGTPGGRVTEGNATSGNQPAAWRDLPSRRPPRRLPEKRRGAGRAGCAAPRHCARWPFHGAEDDERSRSAERRRAPSPQRSHQPHRHHRQADGAVARPPAREGDRPSRAVEAGGDKGRPAGTGRSAGHRCARRSTRAAATYSGCSTSSRPAP